MTLAGTHPGGPGEGEEVPKVLRKKAKVTARFSEPSKVKVKVQLKKRGRFRTVGTLKSKQLGGKAALKLKRKLGKRRLRPGRYRVRAVAIDAAGNRSKVKNAGFRVRR